MRILGVDLGSTSIKAVELDSAFGKFEIHDYYEHAIEPGADIVLALSRMMQALPKQPDRIAIAMPSGQVTFRNLQLPTKDRKAIQSGVGFELDDELPFPLDKAVYDYSVVNQTKQGSFVHVAATLKKHLAATLETWTSAGIDPDLITTESWAYRALFNRMLSRENQLEPVLLIQIGNQNTTLYLHWNNSPIMARQIPWGGRDLTDAIAAKYNLPPDQAETAKLDHGFVIPTTQAWEVTQEQIEFSQALMTPIAELLNELRQAILTCKNLTQRNLSQIYVGGGTSQLPGLLKVIEENLNTPVQALHALSSIATSGVTYSEQTDAVFVQAVSAALCLVGADRSQTINFRKGEFVKQGQTRELNLANLKRPLMAVGAISACMLLSLGFQSWSYNARLKELDAQMEKSLKSFFGTISASAIRTYLSSTTTLRSQINKELSKQRDLAKLAAPNPHSPLDFVKEISTAIPKDVVTDLVNLQVGAAPGAAYSPTAEQNATLTFYVTSPQAADRLNTLLSGKVAGLKREKMEEVPASGNNPAQWKVTFSGKPTEDSYGK